MPEANLLGVGVRLAVKLPLGRAPDSFLLGVPHEHVVTVTHKAAASGATGTYALSVQSDTVQTG